MPETQSYVTGRNKFRNREVMRKKKRRERKKLDYKFDGMS